MRASLRRSRSRRRRSVLRDGAALPWGVALIGLLDQELARAHVHVVPEKRRVGRPAVAARRGRSPGSRPRASRGSRSGRPPRRRDGRCPCRRRWSRTRRAPIRRERVLHARALGVGQAGVVRLGRDPGPAQRVRGAARRSCASPRRRAPGAARRAPGGACASRSRRRRGGRRGRGSAGRIPRRRPPDPRGRAAPTMSSRTSGVAVAVNARIGGRPGRRRRGGSGRRRRRGRGSPGGSRGPTPRRSAPRRPRTARAAPPRGAAENAAIANRSGAT